MSERASTAIVSGAVSSVTATIPDLAADSPTTPHHARTASSWDDTRPPVSSRIQSTLDPCVVLMNSLVGQYASEWQSKGGIYSLAQGVVYWKPPSQVTTALRRAVNAIVDEIDDAPIRPVLDNDSNNTGCPTTNSTFDHDQTVSPSSRLATYSDEAGSHWGNLHMYGPDEGLPALRLALEQKIANENGLTHHHVMVTVGANQAYMNAVLTLLSSDTDRAVVFRPYYFNHVMALQMTLVNAETQLLIGPSREMDGYPDFDWLAQQLELQERITPSCTGRIRMVTITNPCNPTGVYLNRQYLQRAVDLCRHYQVWLVLDCTYENFVESGASSNHEVEAPPSTLDGCFTDPHVIHIFSFSKAYALAGYRCGYIVIAKQARGDASVVSPGNPTETPVDQPIPRDDDVFAQMMKVQDTIPIAPSRLTQIAALGALTAGPEWVRERVRTLSVGRAAIRQALSELGITNELGQRNAPTTDSLIGTSRSLIITGGSGAMYFMAQLPMGVNDVEFCQRLVKDYGVAVIPGTFCGSPGWIRVCYANLPPLQCQDAAGRLAAGLRSLRTGNE